MSAKKKTKAAPLDASEAAARKHAGEGFALLAPPPADTAPITAEELAEVESEPVAAEELAEVERLTAVTHGAERLEARDRLAAMGPTLLPRLVAEHREALAMIKSLRTDLDSCPIDREQIDAIRARAAALPTDTPMATRDLVNDLIDHLRFNAADFSRREDDLTTERENAEEDLVERTAERDALAAKVESLIARCDALEGLVETMIAEAHAHRDGVKTDRSGTAALASERLWAAANEAREALEKARR